MMSRLVPKLRFKEFGGEWDKRKLGKVCEIYNGSTPKTIKPEYWNGEINWITPAEMGNNKYVNSTIRKITKKGLKESNTRLLPIDSIILSCRAPIGYVAINKEKMSFNQGCKGILAKNIDYEFLYYLLNLSKIKLENLGSGNTFKEISTNNLKEMKVSFPKDQKEQQKIASCLSSLDSLIEAQNKKVSALKQHKKGLMQQLFPAEGEREPKLRFKAFSGEWEERELEDVGNIVTGTTPSTKKDKFYQEGVYPWVTPTDITEKKDIFNTKKSLTQKGLDVGRFVPRNSLLVTCIASIGKNTILRKNGSCNQQINSITPYKDCNVDFLYYLIEEKNYILKENAGQGGMAMLNKNDFSNLKFCVSHEIKEQQKIANTLSTLDSLIEVQNQQINHLKQHKKGLMQQMFVSSEVGV
jgi:type I restriction enzyme S subunit